MRWHGPALDSDQRDLMAVLDDFATGREAALADDPDVVARLVRGLVALGVWTLGTPEEHGGGGADRATTALVLERLGRRWPALGWACAQAHAAVGVLAPDERCAGLTGRVHAGTAAVAVVDAGSAHVRLAWSGDTLTGTVDRVDAAAEAPYLLVLAGEDHAYLADPSACTARPVRRTGLGGALTRSLEVEASGAALLELTGVDAAAARVRLRLGAAAVAAGLAAVAAATATAYAAERRQFGAALTALPTVRQSLLDQTTRGAVALAAALAVADDPVRSLAAARAACDGAIDVAAAALQAHGGYGYLAEYPAERYLRDAVSLRAAADVQGAAVAAARTLVGLGPAPSPRKDGR
ncbi:acyl-CoA dehydrogenase family protein [Streptomyces sp. AD55]|uniref:acyl-CoA dehydrogenase family protein n=1 Tax=Streptomyces sp. AD55 TaxID=3242895 RepID=UPI003528C8EB